MLTVPGVRFILRIYFFLFFGRLIISVIRFEIYEKPRHHLFCHDYHQYHRLSFQNPFKRIRRPFIAITYQLSQRTHAFMKRRNWNAKTFRIYLKAKKERNERAIPAGPRKHRRIRTTENVDCSLSHHSTKPEMAYLIRGSNKNRNVALCPFSPLLLSSVEIRWIKQN
jgi:hypothetical protein